MHGWLMKWTTKLKYGIHGPVIKRRWPSLLFRLHQHSEVSELTWQKSIWRISGHSKYRGIVMKPGELQKTIQNEKVWVGRPTAAHIVLLCAHTLCINHETETWPFLMFTCPIRSKRQWCFAHGQGQKIQPKKKYIYIYGTPHSYSLLFTIMRVQGIYVCLRTGGEVAVGR